MIWTKVNKALPTPSDAHIDRALEMMTIGYEQALTNFVAPSVFPAVDVANQTDKYFIFDKDDWRRDEMALRADSTESDGGGFRLSNSNYSCDVYALHKDLGNQLLGNMDAGLALDQAATKYLAQQKLIRQEVQWASDFFATGKWATDKTVGTLWDNDNSDPIGDVAAGRDAILLATGQEANKMVVGKTVDTALKKHPDIIARLDRGQTGGAAQATNEALAALFEVDEYLVMKASYVTSNEGAATATNTWIGGKHALLTHTPDAPGLMVPAAGLTFDWTGLPMSTSGLTVARWWNQDRKAWRYEIEAAFDMKITGSDLGYFFASVVA